MQIGQRKLFVGCFFTLFLLFSKDSFSQKTVIRGFVDVLSTFEKGKVGFGLRRGGKINAKGIGEIDMYFVNARAHQESLLV
ncbi:MAG: hypothetical protein M3040_04760 [Bacteroidota bacterium]|nr:hypothetical protein [Bacteroidota bacterium]